ncbi:hypothetical protein M501DRAFT_706983 [Patellaria atrata CBS 101060]|uniref:F-box domain-containing protein n=1 Tax=Patellaria atrata CBS 101060 TaxID=1346257 RepID=A0A9P4VP46_9PEZI|nr:hypothetical protein M501DRAFT_706983 [Patellaria atrata CBS 101060]
MYYYNDAHAQRTQKEDVPCVAFPFSFQTQTYAPSLVQTKYSTRRPIISPKQDNILISRKHIEIGAIISRMDDPLEQAPAALQLQNSSTQPSSTIPDSEIRNTTTKENLQGAAKGNIRQPMEDDADKTTLFSLRARPTLVTIPPEIHHEILNYLPSPSLHILSTLHPRLQALHHAHIRHFLSLPSPLPHTIALTLGIETGVLAYRDWDTQRRSPFYFKFSFGHDLEWFFPVLPSFHVTGALTEKLRAHDLDAVRRVFAECDRALHVVVAKMMAGKPDWTFASFGDETNEDIRAQEAEARFSTDQFGPGVPTPPDWRDEEVTGADWVETLRLLRKWCRWECFGRVFEGKTDKCVGEGVHERETWLVRRELWRWFWGDAVREGRLAGGPRGVRSVEEGQGRTGMVGMRYGEGVFWL